MARIQAIEGSEKTAIEGALDVLSRGEPVAIPTETVYGLAADATNPAAIARIYEIKGRPRFNPLIAHMADLAMAERHATFNPLARRLAETFWPGALTLVLPLKADSTIHPLATSGLDSVAIRVPKGFAARVIAAFGRPLAAPSANLSGKISPTTARHVAEDIGGRIELILDGGPCRVGVESTIVEVGDKGLRLLRPGGVPASEIEAVAGLKLTRPGTGAAIVAPGMLASHYAPEAALRLNARQATAGEAVIRFGGKALEGDDKAALVLDLSPSGDLREAAANLFAFLKQADRCGANSIAVAAVPDTGLGEAINDRLARAAAPRDAP